ncbi:MAG: hypothetical protein M9942_10050 [Microthrixaceae bacterium]|nr:hypothetical protein [Microthrixaceae bacterium]MCO5318766.1 hypothetical protein [Microthrixaceae bacterium]
MGGVPELRSGLSTLPAVQPARSVPEALGLVFCGRSLPTVPVLPVAGSTLLAQVCGAFAGVTEYAVGRMRVDPNAFGVSPADALSTDGDAFGALHEALAGWSNAAVRERAEAVRVDMLGPVTIAVTLMEAGVPRATALDAARMAAAYRSEALFGAWRAVEEHLPVVVVMFEPRLVGSAHPTFPLTGREVRSLLDPVVDALDTAAGTSDVVIGVQVPGRCDLRTVISSGISMLCIPPDASVVGWAHWIQALLDNGGHVAWGAVPVDRPLGTNAELLWRHLSAIWRDLAAAGVDSESLVRRSLVTPGDALDGFAPAQVPGVVSLLDALGERVAESAAAHRVPRLVPVP